MVLYGCKTWVLTLREENRPGIFDDRVLGRIFVPKRDEVIGGCRKLQNKELSDFYSWRRETSIGYWRNSQKEKTTKKTKT
jgi:hypothetical protein